MNNTNSRAAVIDVGTNSIKMTIGEIDQSGRIKVISETSVISRIGENLETTGLISDQGAERAIAAISDQLALASKHNVHRIRLVGTNALRDAANAREFIEDIHKRLGVDIVPITGDEEARYSYAAIAQDPVFDLTDGALSTADIGGGSTEIVHGAGGQILASTSISVGAVRVTELFLQEDPPAIEQVNRARSYIMRMLADADKTNPDKLVCIGGSAINAGRMIKAIPFERTPDIHAVRIGAAELSEMIGNLSNMPLANRMTVTGLDPKRADIIIGGALIIECLMQYLGVDAFYVSTKGLRHAILFELLQTGEQANP